MGKKKGIKLLKNKKTYLKEGKKRFRVKKTIFLGNFTWVKEGIS